MTNTPSTRLREHREYPRTDASQYVIMAVGHRSAAYFADLDASVRYASFLLSVNYSPAAYPIAEFDRLAAADMLPVTR
jgi:hypothetical protein